MMICLLTSVLIWMTTVSIKRSKRKKLFLCTSEKIIVPVKHSAAASWYAKEIKGEEESR